MHAIDLPCQVCLEHSQLYFLPEKLFTSIKRDDRYVVLTIIMLKEISLKQTKTLSDGLLSGKKKIGSFPSVPPQLSECILSGPPDACAIFLHNELP